MVINCNIESDSSVMNLKCSLRIVNNVLTYVRKIVSKERWKNWSETPHNRLFFTSIKGYNTTEQPVISDSMFTLVKLRHFSNRLFIIETSNC